MWNRLISDSEQTICQHQGSPKSLLGHSGTLTLLVFQPSKLGIGWFTSIIGEQSVALDTQLQLQDTKDCNGCYAHEFAVSFTAFINALGVDEEENSTVSRGNSTPINSTVVHRIPSRV